MEKDRTIIYAIIFWLGWGMIAAWIILKLLGIFESSMWQEMVPYAGAIFAAGIFYQMVYDLRVGITRIENRQDKMAHGLVRLESDFARLQKDFNNLRQDFSNLSQDFGILRKDFDRHLAKY